jgi:hypothetical protein
MLLRMREVVRRPIAPFSWKIPMERLLKLLVADSLDMPVAVACCNAHRDKCTI